MLTTGRSKRQRRGPFSHQRGQEPGVRPADGLVSATTNHLSFAERLQPHGHIFGLLPPQGQPLHPIPGFLPLRRGGRLCREEREENHQGVYKHIPELTGSVLEHQGVFTLVVQLILVWNHGQILDLVWFFLTLFTNRPKGVNMMIYRVTGNWFQFDDCHPVRTVHLQDPLREKKASSLFRTEILLTCIFTPISYVVSLSLPKLWVVGRSDIRRELRVEPLLLYVERACRGGSAIWSDLWRSSRRVQLEGDPTVDPEFTEGIVNPIWAGNCRRAISRIPCLTCRLRDPISNKQKVMDGREIPKEGFKEHDKGANDLTSNLPRSRPDGAVALWDRTEARAGRMSEL